MPQQALIERRFQVEEVALDIENDQVTGPNGTHHLTPMERRLLQVLMCHPGRVVSRAFLMKAVWRTDYLDDMRTLEVHICWLRKKVEVDPHRPQYLRTVRGVGYIFAPV